MQHVRQLGPFTEHQPSVAPLRVTTVRPARWQQAKAWAERTWAAEKAEIILGAATISLVTVLVVSFARALAHYTIIPWP